MFWYIFGISVLVLIALCLTFGTYRVFRIPLVIFFVSLIGLELTLYVVLRWCVALTERLCLRKSHRHYSALRQQLDTASTYNEYRTAALELDRLEDREEWKSRAESRYYHHTFLKELLGQMRAYRASGNISALMSVVHNTMHLGGKAGGGGGVAGMMNEALYSKTYVGTKHLIEQFVDETVKALDYINRYGTGAHDDPLITPDPVPETESDRTTTSRSFTTSEGGESGAGEEDPSADRSGAALWGVSGSGSGSGGRGSGSGGSGFGGAGGGTYTASDCSLDFKSVSAAAHSLTPALGDDEERRNWHATKTEFFRDARRAYGQTALCLSGGASLGNYHWYIHTYSTHFANRHAYSVCHSPRARRSGREAEREGREN